MAHQKVGVAKPTPKLSDVGLNLVSAVQQLPGRKRRVTSLLLEAHSKFAQKVPAKSTAVQGDIVSSSH